MKSKRGQIAEALREALLEINLANGYNTEMYNNVMKRFIFPDDSPQLPLISFTTGIERIEYQPGGAQDRYLNVSLRCYIEDNTDSITAVENIVQDVEEVIEKYSRLRLADGSTIRDMRVTLIDTDQGILAPLGMAEMQIIVEY